MTTGVTIRFNQSTFNRLKAHGKARNAGKEAYPSSEAYGNLSGDTTNVLGATGEAAIAKLFSVKMDTRIHSKGDGGVTDLTVFGVKCAVKTNTYQNGDLYFNPPTEKHGVLKAQCAFLTIPATPDWHDMRIVGFITRTDFDKLYTVKDWGYGNRHCIPQDLLRNPWTFPECALAHFKVINDAQHSAVRFICKRLESKPLPTTISA